MTTLRAAQGFDTAAPRIRAWAARTYGVAAAVGGRWPEAVAGFEAAILLLSRLAPRSLLRADQETQLLSLSDLACDAAACCVRAGLADRAIELFEQGRGVLLGQALDLRTDLAQLTNKYPALARQFEVLRGQLDDDDPPHAEGSGPNPPVADPTRRRQLAEEFEQLIVQIRAAPGFAGFLRPLTASELAAVAADGPVVAINVSRIGSHALILTGEGIRTPVPLPGLTTKNVEEQVAGYLSIFHPAAVQKAAQQRLTVLLGWLWESVARPVLEELGYDGPTNGEWPRLWWCVSGMLSFLPLHAAGHHHTRLDQVPQTVTDRAISSYTPTIRALAHSRRQHAACSDDSSPQVLVVAMPATPGAAPLPGASREARFIEQRFPHRVVTMTGAQATHDAVLAALPTARWAHFACHATANAGNPSAGCLLLEDFRERPLTVTDIIRLRLDDADLAFLSACSTTRPGVRLPDEAIHLTSAFQIAGYRHVIGTLWPINDQFAGDIADELYAAIASSGTYATATALHSATRHLRDRLTDTPTVWASHIHCGA